MKQFGLIGERLGHSHSPALHALLADYRYDLWPLPPGELDAFLRGGRFDGLNVTIPYKRAVIPYLAEMSEAARAIGSVNTILRRADGTLYGDNTDACGLAAMAERAGMRFAGQKTVILGSGGTARTARHVAEAAGGRTVTISRSGPDNYDNLERHADAAYLINTTPVGMWPQEDAAPVDLRRLPGLRGVADAVYNPLRTRLIRQAQALGIPCAGGLCMLARQAVRAAELFTGGAVDAERAARAEEALRRRVTNLVLVGMPGSGKSTVGALAARRLGMPLADLDEEIVAEAGRSIPEIFAAEGEAGFRLREAGQVRRWTAEGGRVLVTGGGAVLDPLNRERLRMNGLVVWITRPLERLSTDGRPLSRGAAALEAMLRVRAPLYAEAADCTVPNEQTPDACARAVEEAYHEAVCH